MKQRNITYRLQTNKMQFTYLKNEVQKTRRLYLSLCKEVRKEPLLTRKQLEQKLHAELKLTNLKLYKQESETIIDKVLRYQESNTYECLPAFYICEQFCEQLFWRGLNLEKLLQIEHFWQREPLYFHWNISYCALFYRQYHFYLIVRFEQYS